MQPTATSGAPSVRALDTRRTQRGKKAKDWRSMAWALLFLGPNFVLFLIFMAYPVGYGLYLSFFNYNVIDPPEWVGLRNYTRFFEDPFTATLIKNSLYYAFGAILPSLVLPLFIAVLLNNAGRGRKLWRGIYFLPLVTSSVAAAAVWKWLYAKDFGLVNYGLRQVGGEPIDWLFSLDWAMPAIIIMTIWLLLPINTIFYTAGLQEISKDYYDAAALDGASAWRQFLDITVPLITPTTFFVLITTMIGVLFGGFDVINVMTQGGPLDATNILIYDIYQNAFQYFRMGYASAEAYILFVFIFLFTVLNWVLQKKWVHYA